MQLLNAFQHDFPLVARPYAEMARRLGTTEQQVIDGLRAHRESGALSRIGAVWARGAGGAGALCALAVPPQDIERVADIVSREPSVNHNYQREHAWNLWYVITSGSEQEVRETADRIQQAAQVPQLFLPMLRAYRVDLGFDLDAPGRATRDTVAPERAMPVAEFDKPLAALAEEGLALIERPFDLWAAELETTTPRVLSTIEGWKAAGTLRRFGVVVRHHDVGIAANAMTVVQVPAGEADALGLRIARQPGVTLSYRRVTAPGWPYNVYFMVHGRERAQVERLVAQVLEASGANSLPHETLFSVRRFKQTGGRYFASPAAPCKVTP